VKNKIITLLLITNSFIIYAQDKWERMDTPDSVEIYSINVSENNDIYIGTAWDTYNGGVYKKTGDNEEWSFIGLRKKTVHSLELYSNTLFAGTNSGIYIDQGNNDWQLVFDNPNNIISIAYSNDYFLAGTWKGIYKSSDDGENWNKVLELGVADVINDFIELSNGRLLAAHTGYDGGGTLYYSDDKGDTWNIAGLERTFLQQFAIDSQNNIYVVSYGGYDGMGRVFRSDDFGMNWEEIYARKKITSIIITPEDDIYIGATGSNMWYSGGVFMSHNYGQTWEVISEGTSGNVEELYLGANGYLYAICSELDGYEQGIYRTIEPVSSSINKKNNQNEKLSVYPNPFSQTTNIEFTTQDYNENIELTVIDISGKQILKKSMQNLASGNHSIEIQMENSLPGIYFCKIHGTKFSLISKLIKN
jgi:hypothetical protein